MEKVNRREQIAILVNLLKENREALTGKIVTAGFDGFIDTILRVVKNKQATDSAAHFTRIGEFGEYITGKQGSSFSLETEEKAVRIGGNTALMANAMGKLGLQVNCIGAFGYPHIHPAFENISSNCRLYSFTDPGSSTAFEFNDGKIMLAQMGQLNILGWEAIKDRIGANKLLELYTASGLLCFVNWGEIDVSTNIWKGMLKDILPAIAKDGKARISFFDLSDCSKKDPASIKEAVELLSAFGPYSQRVLGLNKNEAGLVYQSLLSQPATGTLDEMGEMIYQQIQPDLLLLHSTRETLLFNKDGKYSCDSFFTPDPATSTGAGDNFNAGFCTAQLLELSPSSALVFANGVAGYYIRNGVSPGMTELIEFLEGAATA